MTSWIFSAHGVNFVKITILLGKEQRALSVADDQIGGPTAAADIAATLRQMAVHLRRDNSCIHYYAGAPNVSWIYFATADFFAGQAPS